ncbi:MAG: hypothetical protein AAFN70_02920, partial [Planctomycetota bacterium]
MKRRLRVQKLGDRILMAAEGSETVIQATNVDVVELVGNLTAEVDYGNGRSETLSVPRPEEGRIKFRFEFLNTSFLNAGRRSVIQAAGNYVASLLDDSLKEIRPVGNDQWTPQVINPNNPIGPGNQPNFFSPNIQVVPANEIVVYVGAATFTGDFASSDALAGYSGYSNLNGSADFVDTVQARGQSGALATAPTDIGPWGGFLSLNASRSFSATLDPAQIAPGEIDLFAVASHEL